MGLIQGDSAGVWVRVSSGGQDEANQLPDIQKHCAGNGYEVARTYTLHGKSASKGEQQPYLDRMLADMRAGLIKVLVIWHSDRLERRPGKALLDVLAEVAAAGGRVESVQEPALGKLDFGSQVTTFIAGLVNHEKSVHLAAQVSAAFETIHTNGGLHGRNPFGYVATGSVKYHHTLEPTELGRKYVPQIFARVIAGESLNTIARWLEAEGVAPTSGTRWWARSLGLIIRNPTYMGQRADAEGRTIHRCEALVDAGVFRRAGEALDGRPKRGPANAANRAMLATAIHCSRCGDSPMYRSGVDGSVYRCTGRGAARKGCGNNVSLAAADKAVNVLARRLFGTPVMVTRTIPGSDHGAELELIRYEMRQLALLDLPDAEMDAELARLRTERDRLTALPSVPDRVEEVATSQTYADLWRALGDAERGPWLVSHGFRVLADKSTVRLTRTTAGPWDDDYEPVVSVLVPRDMMGVRLSA
jgi:DNA invertase Pin-like site-specific DNA recombinase